MVSIIPVSHEGVSLSRAPYGTFTAEQEAAAAAKAVRDYKQRQGRAAAKLGRELGIADDAASQQPWPQPWQWHVTRW